MSGTFKQTILDNGMVVLTESMPSAETTSVGIFFGAGALNETDQNNGVAHFLEHMAFKGTERRSAFDIAQEVEDVGGYMNAFTDRETTAYYLKVLPEHVDLGLDILADVLQRSVFAEEEMAREREVILQEMHMYKDNPSSAVYDLLQERAYHNQPMGRNILGSEQTVINMNPSHIRGFIDAFYGLDNMVFCASGVVDHDIFASKISGLFEGFKSKVNADVTAPSYTAGRIVEQRKDVSQAHLLLAYQGVSYHDVDYFPLRVWSAAVGSGMASPLFQEVREKRGLAYSTYTYCDFYKQSGLLGVYAGASLKDVPDLRKVIEDQLHKAAHQVDVDGVERAKAQIKAGIKMGMESSDGRMERMAFSWLIFGRYVPLEEIVSNIEAVTPDVAEAAAQRALASQQTLAAVGPAGIEGALQ